MKNSDKVCQTKNSVVRHQCYLRLSLVHVYCSLSSLSFTLFPCSPLLPSLPPLRPAPDVYWLPEFIQEHHLMCLLSCPAFVARAAAHDIANWSVSPRHPLSGFVKWTTITLAHSPIRAPAPLRLPPFWVSFARSVSFLSFREDGIGMAKHWCESWLAEPHAWPAALMSSLRFDDVANKRTLLIIWPPTFSVTTTSPPPHPLPPHHPPSRLLLSIVLLRWRLENEVMLVWTQTRALVLKGSPSLKWFGARFYRLWEGSDYVTLT